MSTGGGLLYDKKELNTISRIKTEFGVFTSVYSESLDNYSSALL